MAITTAMANVYKQDLMLAKHNHAVGAHVFFMALYDITATLDATTGAYTATGEVTGTGYSAGGQSMTNVAPNLVGSTAFTQWANVVWANSTITAGGCLIYNSTTPGNPSVSIHDFGAEFSSSNGDFSVIMPTFDQATALVRLV